MDGGKIMVLGILVSLVLGVAAGAEVKGLGPCSFPAIYNFGDSNSDTGAFSTAIYPSQPPVGQTFFGKPAGRASDGRLIIDFIAEQLKLPYLSAYLDSIGTNFSHGANFAVGAGTIRRQNDTPPYVCPFHFGIQTTQFNQFKARTIDIFNRGKNTSRLPRPEDFSKALYTLDIGQNDVYRLMFGSLRIVIPNIIDQFAAAVQTLYCQGARTFWIHNVGPNGCLPAAQHDILDRAKETFDQNGCNNRFNEMVMEYNRKLKDTVIKLRAQLPEAAITYVDVYAAKYKLISNAKNLGFTSPLKICTSHWEKKNGRLVEVPLCKNPSTYISWDGVHYTEAANHLIANSILNGSFSDPPLPITLACHKHVSM